MMRTVMRVLASGLVAGLLGAALPLPATAQPWAGLPHQPVTSLLGMMNELQKRGPNAYVYGPYEGGQYIVVGPVIAPPYAAEVRHRARKSRKHRAAWVRSR